MNTLAAEPIANPAAVDAAIPALDHDGFRSVVEAYSSRLFNLAYRMTGQRQDAEDLVQECFLRAYRSRDRYQARASMATWLYRICTNAALDHLRKRNCRPLAAATPGEDDRGVEAVSSPSPSPERLAMDGELSLRVRAAMAQLSPKERAAFVLRHYQGCSIEEISATLGLRPGATKNTIFRGVRKLRAALESHR